ncbi:hypothetical protein RUND412_011653 [Rhizina undulata]
MSIVITGATGGLGRRIIDFLLKFGAQPSDIIGITRSLSKAPADLIAKGVTFRQADFNEPGPLEAAFAGASKVLVVSTNTFDIDIRNKQHANAIDAAKKAGIGRVYYTSLALGGYGHSDSDVQASHLYTEDYLKKSGVEYTIIREGIYTEAFPLFLNWEPTTKKIHLPGDGPIAFAARTELAEANARLLLGESHKNSTALLSGPEAITLREIAELISETLNLQPPIEFKIIPEEEYIQELVRAGKEEWFARKWVTTYVGLERGDGGFVTGVLEELLGRKPKGAREYIAQLLRESNGQYRWHQQESARGAANETK